MSEEWWDIIRKPPVSTPYLFKSLFGADYFPGAFRKGKRSDMDRIDDIHTYIQKCPRSEET
jgi:hypothetical protein